MVEQKNTRGDTFPCSMYPDVTLGGEELNSMRVNCIVDPAIKIIIRSHKNFGFSISGIDVYTLTGLHVLLDIMFTLIVWFLIILFTFI